MMSVAIPLYLFAKAPVAGRAKKRMCPPLSKDQAASLACALLENAVSIVESGWPGQCVLSATPDLSHPAFTPILQSQHWKTQLQPSLDLGGRMQQALQTGITEVGAAAVLGTDIPAINADILQQAYQALTDGQQVVGPTPDGGFYFLGVNTIPDALFSGIEWGSDQVFSRLMQNAAEIGLTLERLPALSDCDDYEDLKSTVINGRPGLSFAEEL